MDALVRVESSSQLDKRIKKSIASRMRNVTEGIRKVEQASGLNYPPYYVEPILTVVPPVSNPDEGLGILYARTIPLESSGKVTIIVQLSAPLILYGTKPTVRLVLAHEFLHYIELVRQFVTMDLSSQISASTIFEERYADSSRAVDPGKVFKDKKLVRDLVRKTSSGLDEPKLNEKCYSKWIDKGLPIQKLPMGRNQAKVSVGAISRTEFDPSVRELVIRFP